MEIENLSESAPDLTSETLDFVKEIIRRTCQEKGFSCDFASKWMSFRDNLSVEISQERCRLEYPEYPNKNGKEHFPIKVNGLIRVSENKFLLVLAPQDNEEESTKIDLTDIQKLRQFRSWNSLKDSQGNLIRNAVIMAFWNEEMAILKFRRKPVKL